MPLTRGRRRTTAIASVVLVLIAALAVSATSALAADRKQLSLELCAPDENRFTLNIDNPYFPLPVGGRWVLQGEDEGETIGVRITVLNRTETLYSGRNAVTTRVVEEREWADENANGRINRGEELIEVSLNYFAQTQDGTVCYFGEAVDIYEGGEVVSHEGSWRADQPGNAPGIYMPARPRPGMSFQMEVAPGVAEDRGTIVRSGTVTVPAGTFRDTIAVEEVNPLDGSTSSKVYARDVGLIIDEPLELIRYRLPDGRNGGDDNGGRDDDD